MYVHVRIAVQTFLFFLFSYPGNRITIGSSYNDLISTCIYEANAWLKKFLFFVQHP